MRSPLLILCWLALSGFLLHHHGGGGVPLSVVSEEEFVGPLSTWINAQTGAPVGGGSALCTGATGNGTTDDTTALQSCLTILNTGSASVATHPVVWLPPGTYKITHTLNLGGLNNPPTGAINVGLIGADPATTSIVWAGGNSVNRPQGTNGAKGAGATDFTDATANAFTPAMVGMRLDLNSGTSCNVAFYFITAYVSASTVTLNATPGASCSAASWGMDSGATMLYMDGVAYSRVNRITFNGAGATFSIAVDESYIQGIGFFDVQNEYTDDVFENASIGFNCGQTNAGCADVAILRDTFSANNTAGVRIGNANALGIYVWYSTFIGDYQGVFNYQGNFSAINNNFQASTFADFSIQNPGEISLIGNYSIGSNIFVNSGFNGSAGPLTMLDNTVLDATCATCSGANFSVFNGNNGPVTAIDNVFRSRSGGTTGPVIETTSAVASDLFSMNNIFTAGTTPNCTVSSGSSPVFANGTHCHTIGDQIVARSTINPVQPTLPSTPPNYGRTIYEASPTGSGSTCSFASPCSIQGAVTKAATAEAAGTPNPVVHIEAGSYSITSTITVPATVNSGIQIIGDGANSAVNWTGSPGGPVMQLTGPSKVTVANFAVNGDANTAGGLLITAADQPGARVYGEQATANGSQTNFLVNGLQYTRVELHQLYHGQNDTVGGAVASLDVVGGSPNHGSATNVFNADGANDNIGYLFSGTAQLYILNAWHDGAAGGGQIVNGSGSGAFSDIGSTLYLHVTPPGTSNGTTVALNGFTGNAGLVGLFNSGDGTTSTISLAGSASGGQVLLEGVTGQGIGGFLTDTTSPADTKGFLDGFYFTGGGGSAELAESGTSTTPFITATLAQMRSTLPVQRTPTSAGVTDVGIYRVFVSNALVGFDLEH